MSSVYTISKSTLDELARLIKLKSGLDINDKQPFYILAEHLSGLENKSYKEVVCDQLNSSETFEIKWQSIPSYAFASLQSIKNVNFPNKILEIPEGLFMDSGVEYIHFDVDPTGEENGFYIGARAFAGCGTEDKPLYLHFSNKGNNSNWSQGFIPNLKYIGEQAFANTYLGSYYVEGLEQGLTIENDVFLGASIEVVSQVDESIMVQFQNVNFENKYSNPFSVAKEIYVSSGSFLYMDNMLETVKQFSFYNFNDRNNNENFSHGVNYPSDSTLKLIEKSAFEKSCIGMLNLLKIKKIEERAFAEATFAWYWANQNRIRLGGPNEPVKAIASNAFQDFTIDVKNLGSFVLEIRYNKNYDPENPGEYDYSEFIQSDGTTIYVPSGHEVLWGISEDLAAILEIEYVAEEE